MSSSARTKALVIVVVALLLLWFIGDRYGMRSKDRTYREVVLTLDTAQVKAIVIEPGGTLRPDVRVVREDRVWRLYAKTDTLRVDNKYVLDVLAPLADMRVKRQVGTMDLVKDRYDLSDTLADRMVIELNDGSKNVLLIGKSTFSPKGPWSHVNVAGEREVFAVDGKLSMVTEMKVEDWRPRTVVIGDSKNWSRLHYRFPGNDYVLQCADGIWMLDSVLSDTARVAGYLSSLARSEAHSAAKGASLDSLPEVATLTITDVSRPAPIVVSIYATRDARFLLHSSLNPDNLLWFDAERELPRLFRPRGNWLPGATPTSPLNPGI